MVFPSRGRVRAAAEWRRHVAAAGSGELSAFGWLYDQTADLLYGYLVDQGYSDADAKLRQAYLSYWVALPRLRNRDRHTTTVWLAVAAVR